MPEKKQTAIEWLESQLKKSKYYFKLIEDLGFQSSVVATDVFKLAKQMHRKQSIEDMNKMQIIKDVDSDGNVEFIFNPEQYYKETYENYLTPKQHADKLIDKYRTYIRMADKYSYLLSPDEIHLSVQCALHEVQSNINLIEELENSSEFLLSNKYMELIETKNELTKMLC